MTTVRAAVEADLKVIAKLDAALAKSTLAAAAVVLADELDDPHNSATSKSMCAARLVETMDRLRELTPKQQQKDAVDDLSSRRTKRLSGRSAS